MASMHHLSLRKRAYRLPPNYPHPQRWGRILDRIVILLAGIGPFATVPQVVQVYSTGADNLSLLTWTLYTVLCLPWIVYGFLHREQLILFVYMLNILLCGAVTVGIVLYA